jgi:hypothetical protein
MDKKPTGFIAKCKCGAITGALDADRTERKDMGKMLGKWLMHGRTIEPRFGDWTETLTACTCPTQQHGASGE